LKYLLDTSTCIGLINDKYPVRSRLTRAERSGGEFYISAVSVFELSREIGKGSPDPEAQLLEAFLSGPVTILALEEEDARAASYVESALRNDVKTEASDALIAGQALARKMVLVRVGTSTVVGVKGLNSQDWGKP
jgi:predicted nucleic acid-binding protein